MKQNRINGFHIDPYHGEEAADIIADFFEKSAAAKAKADAKARSRDDGGGGGDSGGGGDDKGEDEDEDDPWLRISSAGLKRIASRYTWQIYACRLATLTSVYAFWKRSGRSRLLSSPEKSSYLDVLTKLVLRPLISRVRRARDSVDEGEGDEEEGEEEEDAEEGEEVDKDGKDREKKKKKKKEEDAGGCEAACGVALGVFKPRSKGSRRLGT